MQSTLFQNPGGVPVRDGAGGEAGQDFFFLILEEKKAISFLNGKPHKQNSFV